MIQFYDAAPCGDFAAARKLLDPQIEWIEPDVKELWFAGTHRGADAVFNEVIGPCEDKVADFRVEMTEFYEVGDNVIAIGRFTGRGKQTGRALNAATAHVWTLRDGKAVRFEAYHDTANWLEALGEARPETMRQAA